MSDCISLQVHISNSCSDRMPPQIGQFISAAVYEDKLKSNPKHEIKDDVIACRFIDAKGKESKSGDSYKVSRPYMTCSSICANHDPESH